MVGTAVGAESGDTYLIVILGGEASTHTGLIDTSHESFLVLRDGPGDDFGDSFMTTQTVHTTVNANGELTAEYGDFKANCIGNPLEWIHPTS